MSATKSEDIRLQMNNVRHKKGDGTLYLMAERLAWMPNAKNNFTISHKYSDIKMQKISPEGKAKIQLQIVLQTGDNTTFQFANLEDRTAVKDALLQILPLFKGMMPKDRERKALLLSKNPHLLQLYKDLVETKIITVDEFWSQFVDEQCETGESQMEQQDVGVSANFLSGIPLNGKQMKGTVNVETLYAILKTYPKVAKRHQELVPTKMTETEFWNKFFQSRYFNRDRTKDMFSDCAKSDEREWMSSVKQGTIDPFLDVDMFDDNVYQFNASDPLPGSSHENPDQVLIKRFNQQSIRLLDSLKHKEPATVIASMTTQDSSQSTAGGSAAAAAAADQAKAKQSANNVLQVKLEPGTTAPAGAAAAANGQSTIVVGTTSAQQDNSQQQQQASFRANRRDWTYDDLAGHECNGDFLDEQNRVGSRMHDVDREMYSIIPQNQQQSSQLSSNMVKDHHEAIREWDPQLTDCLAPKDATEALKNLSPSGYLMRSANSNRLSETVPEEVQAKLKSAYYAGNELLRHFWLCFPAVDPTLEAKLVKLHETIRKFESSKLQPFQDSLPRDQRHLLNHLMRRQIKDAYIKFENWKNKKRERETLGSRTRSATNRN